MFRGVNALNLDSKGRMAMPARFRSRLQDDCEGQLVVTVDRDQCLLLYPLPEWENIERKLVKLPSLNKTARRLQRLLIGHATEVEMDGNGRLLLPAPLREYAGLEKKVVLIGQGNKFEIWDEGAWNSSREAWMSEQEDEGEWPDELDSLSL